MPAIPTQRARWPHRAHLVVRVLLGLLFFYAGVSKLIDLQAFARTISDFGILPPVTERTAAFGICSLEIVAGIGLVLGIRGALSVLVALLIGFTATLGYGFWLGLDIDCGCFGPQEAAIFGKGLSAGLTRNCVMLGVCGLLYWLRAARAASLAGRIDQPRGPHTCGED